MNRLQKVGNFISSFFVPVEAKELENLAETINEDLPGLRIETTQNHQVNHRVDLDMTAGFTGGVHVGRRYNPIFTFPFDGEKNPGEMGVIKRYRFNYRGLRNRSWQAYIENDILQGIVHKFQEWVVGEGLRLQAQPVEMILEQAGVSLESNQVQNIEQRFQLYKNSKASTYDKQKTLNQQESEVFKNAIVGGDMLVVLHVENRRIKVQVIDGEHVFTPAFSTEVRGKQGERTEIRDGVEINEKGEHVAYWVWTKENDFQRIEAFAEGGVRMAYLVYGMEYRHDNVRGIPISTGILESLKKIERYKEAAVAGAEERAKIAYFFEHTKESTGENPLEQNVARSLPLNRTIDGGSNSTSESNASITLAHKIVATTGKQTFNLPNETTIKALASDQELNFKDFFMTNLHPICAAVGIPVEVALSKFENNFSSSRAALKQWEHTVKVNRTNFSLQFLKPIYNLWLIMEDVRGDINLPQLFRSQVIDADDILFEAYTNCTFMGVNIPHVDPVKEVEAIRMKLGKGADHIPLTTIQAAIEELGGGDYQQTIDTYNSELEEAPDPPEVEMAGLVENNRQQRQLRQGEND